MGVIKGDTRSLDKGSDWVQVEGCKLLAKLKLLEGG